MKKLLSLLVVASFAIITSCGPSAEEKAAAEKAHQDSITAVMEQMRMDSLAVVEQAQAEATAAAEKMAADSIAAAEAAKAKKPASKPKTTVSTPAKSESVKKADEKVKEKFGKKK